jgi:GT2 family glycosyltransferase
MPQSLGVVIPFHNNARRLDWILEALMPQLRTRDEVMVVDDHSDRPPRIPGENPRARVVSLARGDGPGNRAGARNEGWRNCETDLIVFLDGDMIPSPKFVEALRRLHGEHPRAVVKPARFALTGEEQARGKASCLRDVATVARWCSGARNPRDDGEPTAHWYYAASNALSVERRYIEQITGWDEGYRGWGEEDMDFAYRLHQAGLSFLFPDPESVYAVHLDHAVPDNWVESLERNARRFVAKFPQVYEVRRPAYEACGLPIAGQREKREKRVRRGRLLAYAPRSPWR